MKNFTKKMTFLIALVFSLNVGSADFVINFQPAPNSVGDSEISSISSSKISDFISAITTLFNSLGGGGGTHTMGTGYGDGSNWITYYINPK